MLNDRIETDRTDLKHVEAPRNLATRERRLTELT